MQIWPAIDLRGGRCVRLRQGDYAQETIFSDDPVAMAQSFFDQGARHLHVVDLDGAKRGEPAHLEVIARIVAEVPLEVELGGGIRNEQTIQQLLECGVLRLVLGTSAIKREEWFHEMAIRYPGRLVLGLDAREGFVALDGWLETSRQKASDVAERFNLLPLAAVVFTDIATDGMLAGPNLSTFAEMRAAVRGALIASGGVTTQKDIADLARLGADGCIIGRALYEETLTLPRALAAAKDCGGVSPP